MIRNINLTLLIFAALSLNACSLLGMATGTAAVVGVSAAQEGGLRFGIEFGRDERGKVTSKAPGGKAFALPWPTPLETPDERVASMDRLGVDVHLLSLSPSMHWYSTDPADAAALAERRGRRQRA